jgi:hypothetical protein
MKVTTYVLLASLALNATLLLCKGPNNFLAATTCMAGGTTDPCACDDKQRYEKEEKDGGGQWISTDEGKQAVDRFNQKYKTPYKGAFISKRALDEIFCVNKAANGVVCYFAQGSDDETSVSIIVEGTHKEETKILSGKPGDPVAFMATAKCPVICSAIGN